MQAPMGASTKGSFMFDSLSQRSRFNTRRAIGVASAALAFAFGGSALAQPAHGHGGPHGMGADGGDVMLGHLITNAQAQLKLNTSKNGMFDAAVSQTKAARESDRTLQNEVMGAARD